MSESLETTIKSVVVYRRGARVFREGTITLNAGEHVIEVTGLPRSLDPDSVRVKGTGSGSIVNINVEKHFEETTPQEALDRLKKEIEAKDHEIQDLQRVIQLEADRRAKTEALQSNTYEQYPKYYLGSINLEKFKQIEGFFYSALETASERIQDLNKLLKDLRIERERLQREINQLGHRADVEESFTIKVNLAVTGGAASEFGITASYLMKDAYWVPLYDAIIGEGESHLKLIANVMNYTTEDWTGVILEVSTATISPVTTVKPDPLILRQYVPPPTISERQTSRARGRGGGMKMKSAAPRMDMLMDMEEDMDMPEEGATEPEPEIVEIQADVSESVGVQSYKLPKPVTIPSDKEFHPVTLTTTSLASKKKLFWSVVNPGTVIAQETITNGDLVLLPGKVKTYFQEEYIGESEIPLVAPKQDFELGARASYEITVDKKLVDRAREKKGVVKGKIEREYKYQIKVKNLSQVECPLKLMDRIPHSDSEKIKVEPDFGSHPPAKNKMGVLTWNLDLKNLSEKIIEYHLKVAYDKNITVTPSLP